MGVQDHHIVKTANHLRDEITFSLPAALTASSTIVFGRFSPLYPFQVLGVRLYGLTFTNVTSVDVGIAQTAGGAYVSMLSAVITPSADAEVAGVLNTAIATPPYTYTHVSTGQIIAKYTTGAGASCVSGMLSVVIRPRPVDGEVL